MHQRAQQNDEIRQIWQGVIAMLYQQKIEGGANQRESRKPV
jgi:hypothetical protein